MSESCLVWLYKLILILIWKWFLGSQVDYIRIWTSAVRLLVHDKWTPFGRSGLFCVCFSPRGNGYTAHGTRLIVRDSNETVLDLPEENVYSFSFWEVVWSGCSACSDGWSDAICTCQKDLGPTAALSEWCHIPIRALFSAANWPYLLVCCEMTNVT